MRGTRVSRASPLRPYFDPVRHNRASVIDSTSKAMLTSAVLANNINTVPTYSKLDYDFLYAIICSAAVL